MGRLVAGGFIWFPFHMAMVWYLARGVGMASLGAGIWISKHQSALVGGDGDSQLHHRAEGPRT